MNKFCDVSISLVNDVWIKQLHFPVKGMIANTHAHTHDHQTLLAVGALKVTVMGHETIHRAPDIIVIHAGAYHKLEALDANTVAYCIHALRDGESVVQGVANDAVHLAL
jgi:quercetin dioxygenase-like cupin family protein